jgi:hypothetical protein
VCEVSGETEFVVFMTVARTPLHATACRQSPGDLAIELWNGNYVRLGDFVGHVVLAAFLNRPGCDAPYFLYLLDTLNTEYRDKGFRAIAGLLDLQADEAVPLVTYQYPIGRASRRRLANILGLSMSGFHLPKLVFLDRNGIIQGSYGLGDAFLSQPEDNSRRFVERLLSSEERGASAGVTA